MVQLTLAAPLAALLLAACRQDMHDQPKKEPFEASAFFADGRAGRPQVAGTIARGELREDVLLETGRTADGELSAVFPFEITADVLARGRERYDINCSPCHDRTGGGNGMVVQRGLRAPSSFHTERLRAVPPGYVFDAITNGFGVMFDYADRIAPEDRWAIAAYVRALQLSQNAKLADATPEGRAALEGGGS
jgi:mono/diheme cytochrome c family protein